MAGGPFFFAFLKHEIHNKMPILVRNAHSIRPYQHVLEPLFAYLMIAKRQYENKSSEGWYNIGPDECDCVSTGELVKLFCQYWGEGISWKNQTEANAPHEANFLKLDCAKLKSTFGWKPRWNIERAIQKTVEWTKVWLAGENISAEMDQEITEYLEG